jgi:hypothetical protein
VISGNGPASGTYQLAMDGSLNGFVVNGLSEAILHVNATGAGPFWLSFNEKEFSDPDNAMPSSFTGHGNFDGVALSVDGTNWFRILSLTGADSTNSYQLRSFNLSAIAASFGLTLSADTRIKFQTYDVNAVFIPTQGIAFDDVSVVAVNHAPAGADGTVTTPEDVAYTFAAADFGFGDPSDSPPNALKAVEVTTLPPTGTLKLTGVAVTAGQFVSAADIAVGKLTFNPAADASGSPYATFTFQVQDDGGTANGGADLDPTPNTLTINVTPVNDAPVVNITAGSLTYIANQAAKPIDAGLSVIDVDSQNLSGATVAVTAGFAAGQDVLGFADQNGITGSYNPATGVLTLTGSASLANYQSALRSVTYFNSSASPSTAARTVTVTVNDGSLSNNTGSATRGITVRRSQPSDYDGDGKADVAVYRPGTGGSPSTWFVRASSGANFSVSWGLQGDVPVPADYDGDGKADVAVYRPGTGGSPSTWFVQASSGANFSGGWGLQGDVPVPADYDGDGKADVAVYRPGTGGSPSTWFVQASSGTNFSVGWGLQGDVPVPADYDGDGKADVAVYRPGTGSSASTWFVQASSGANFSVGWGLQGDVPVPADYDGDGKADVAVYRPGTGSSASTWFVQASSGANFSVGWGLQGDRPPDEIPTGPL